MRLALPRVGLFHLGPSLAHRNLRNFRHTPSSQEGLHCILQNIVNKPGEGPRAVSGLAPGSTVYFLVITCFINPSPLRKSAGPIVP